MTATLLSQIRNTVVVDVDSMDPTVAERHSANGTAKFADMTSNQVILPILTIQHLPASTLASQSVPN